MHGLNDYIEYRLSVYIWKWFPPVLILLGSAGNLLAVSVLMQRKNRYSTSALYLTALAVADLLVLWTGLLRQWIKHTFNTDLRDMSVLSCKLHVFLVYVAFHCSSWFLVAFTAERFLTVWFPHKVKTYCCWKNTVISIIIIITCLFILNSHWLYGIDLIPTNINNSTHRVICSVMKDDFYQAFYHQWKWIDRCIHSIIPLTLILVANISIISLMASRKYKRRTKIAPTGGSTKDMMPQLTIMLLTTSTVFIACTAPIAVYIIVYNPKKTKQDIANHFLWWAVVNNLAYLNNTLNFLLYFISGSKFRQQTKELYFCCSRE